MGIEEESQEPLEEIEIEIEKYATDRTNIEYLKLLEKQENLRKMIKTEPDKTSEYEKQIQEIEEFMEKQQEEIKDRTIEVSSMDTEDLKKHKEVVHENVIRLRKELEEADREYSIALKISAMRIQKK